MISTTDDVGARLAMAFAERVDVAKSGPGALRVDGNRKGSGRKRWLGSETLTGIEVKPILLGQGKKGRLPFLCLLSGVLIRKVGEDENRHKAQTE